MRIIILLILVITLNDNGLYAQVGVGTTTPHSSAELDITSANKGLLPPRMTTVQRDAIQGPAQGLMIFNTTTQALEIYTAYGWYGIPFQVPPRKLLGGSVTEQPSTIQQTTDGGYIIAGISNSHISGDVTGSNYGGTTGTTDYWIVKLDANRNISWSKLLGGNGIETCTDISQTTDGGYIIAGYSTSSANGMVSGTNYGTTDYWIVKLNSAGALEWEKLMGGLNNDKAYGIVQTNDGGYIVAGSSSSSETGLVTLQNHGLFDIWIVKLDAVGTILWQRLLGGTGNEEAFDITLCSDGSVVLAGFSTSSANGDVSQSNHSTGINALDFWIVRLNSTGNILWNRLLGGNGREVAYSIQQTIDDGYIITGYSTSSANGDVTEANHGYFPTTDYWVVKLDRFGDISWNKLFGGNEDDIPRGIRQTSDEGYIVSGFSNSSSNGNVTEANHGLLDYWILKLDGLGNLSWNRLIGGSGNEQSFCIIQNTDGSFMVAGFSESSFNGDVTSGNHGASDYWIIKLGGTGTLF